jgi:hypothetical protein
VNASAKLCSGCARTDRPLVVCWDGRELCLACVEAAGDAAEADRDGLAMLRWLTRVAEDGES